MLVSRSQRNRWIARPKPNPDAEQRLFCLPYAGGAASAFYSWAGEVSNHIEVCPIQLPGRENRLHEAPYSELVPLVEDLVKAIWAYLDKPFALFGHSMGAIIGFELCRSLRQLQGPQPMHFFASASPAPQLPIKDRAYDLPQDRLLERLRRLNGTSQFVFENAELLKLFLPLVRTDLAVNDTYVYLPGRILNCSITALGGIDDNEVTHNDLQSWREQTFNRFAVHLFPGDHFYLRGAQAQLLQVINQTLAAPFLEAAAYC